MAAFTTVMTTVGDVDDSILLAYEKAFMVACGQDANLDQVVTVKKSIGAKSIQFPKYSRLAAATTPLTESDDLTSVALVDAPILLTPAEYGNVVTTTKLANLQTGGVADLAAATVVGINLGMTQDALLLAALKASSNAITPANSAVNAVAAGDIATRTFLNKAYNKLARASVPTLGGHYVMIAHDDVISDLRADSSAGSWVDVAKYSAPGEVFANEVGMISGFRVIRNNAAQIVADEGAGAVDNYYSYFLGMNAVGKAVSQESRLVFSGPFDKLGRFVNVGWYGCFQYKIIDTDAVWVGVTSSSLGTNV